MSYGKNVVHPLPTGADAIHNRFRSHSGESDYTSVFLSDCIDWGIPESAWF
jgi:hypothetical protein